MNRGDTTPWQLSYWGLEPDGIFDSTSERLEDKRHCNETLLAWGLEVDNAPDTQLFHEVWE